MHKQGDPQTMQQQPRYQDVVAEVSAFLGARIAAAEAAGIGRERIVIDPGFGFGKTLAHNLALLRELKKLAELGVPVLAGLSRKSMLGALTGQEVGQRLPASVAAALIAVQHGASIVRVHDVRCDGGCAEGVASSRKMTCPQITQIKWINTKQNLRESV